MNYATHYVYAIKYVEAGTTKYYVGITERIGTHKHRYKKKGIIIEFCGLSICKDRYEAVYLESLMHAEMFKYGCEVFEKLFISAGGEWTAGAK